MNNRKLRVNYGFLLKFSLMLALPALLAGCPHHFVNMLDEQMEKKDSLRKRHKNVFISSGLSVSDSSRIKGLLEKDEADSSIIEPKNAAIDDTTAEVISTKDEADSVQVPEKQSLNFEIIKVDDSEYPDKITARAIVYDEEGRYITGLAPPYFEGEGDYRDYWTTLTDSCEGNLNDIIDFQVKEVRKKDASPHAINFVLDHSASMGNRTAWVLQKAVYRLLGSLKDEDWVSVVKFTQKQTVEVPLTNDREKYRGDFKINALRGDYGSGTDIFEGVMAGIEEAMKAPDSLKKIVILFSDGFDEIPEDDLDSLKILTKSNDITIFTISYGLTVNTELMTNIAEYTGGRYYSVYTSKLFPYVFADIYYTLNNYYRITYKPPECASLHTINSHLTFPGYTDKVFIAKGKYDRTVLKQEDPVGTQFIANIEFDFGKANVKEESIPVIRDVASAMKKYPEMKIKITGHTDSIGTEEFNMELSKKRAEAVKEKLVGLGIQPNRLETEGLGESKPLVPNNSEENMRKNRRTEFKIISK